MQLYDHVYMLVDVSVYRWEWRSPYAIGWRTVLLRGAYVQSFCFHTTSSSRGASAVLLTTQVTSWSQTETRTPSSCLTATDHSSPGVPAASAVPPTWPWRHAVTWSSPTRTTIASRYDSLYAKYLLEFVVRRELRVVVLSLGKSDLSRCHYPLANRRPPSGHVIVGETVCCVIINHPGQLSQAIPAWLRAVGWTAISLFARLLWSPCLHYVVGRSRRIAFPLTT